MIHGDGVSGSFFDSMGESMGTFQIDSFWKKAFNYMNVVEGFCIFLRYMLLVVLKHGYF